MPNEHDSNHAPPETGGEATRRKIEPYAVKRACEPDFDTSQLVLQSIDQVDSQYSQRPVLLQNGDITVSWSLEDCKKYFWKHLTGEQKEIFTPQKARVVTYSLGLLFRYRMDWRPKGYGLGELLTSLSLLPNEELMLEFKTWETSSTQQDRESTVEEKNTSDIRSTRSDVREVMDDYHSSESFDLKTHAEASWGWGSASVDANYSTSSKEQHKTTTKRARSGTQKSANTLAQKRSMKVAISRETGSESKTTRKIKNINQCRTLNVNYFQLLKQFAVSMYLYDVEMVLLGNTHQTTGTQLKIGTILPINISEPATAEEHVESLLDYSLDKNPLTFQSTVLKYCTPRPDIDMRDQYGNRRYAFSINPGPMEDRDNDGVAEYPTGLAELLTYLYGFYTAQSPPPGMAELDITVDTGSPPDLSLLETAIVVPRHHFLQGVPLSQFTATVQWVTDKIVDEYQKTRAGLTPEELLDEWHVQVPTNGVYAETMLGACSGCEDYFEVQRQFDLELKQLDIEKLRLEVHKLEIENQRLQQAPPGTQVTIEKPPEDTSIDIDLDVSPGDDDTTIKFDT